MRKPHRLRKAAWQWVFTVVVLCTLAPRFHAQRYGFREYTQGLGNLNIDGLVQDRTGYLWVGTQNGLYRYDGTQFQSYGPAQGLLGRMVQNLFVGMDGTLWVSTMSGIFFQKPDGMFAEVKPPAGIGQLEQRWGNAFAANRPDEVVSLTRAGGILLRRQRNAQWTAERWSLEGTRLWGAVYAPDGALWYGCDNDLCRLANGKSARMASVLGLPPENWSSFLVTREKRLWIRGRTHVGEIDLATNKFTLHKMPSPNSPEAYPLLVEDAKGRIITAQLSTLLMWEKNRWRTVTDRNGLARYEIQSLYVDREGSLWIGKVGHGLKRWVGQDRWEGYTVADGLSNDLVWSILRDRKGRLWVGTESGLDWMSPGTVTPRPWKQLGTATTRIAALAETTDGAIWAGGTAGDLIRVDLNTLSGRHWKLPPVFNIVADTHGQLWIATNGGLFTTSLHDSENNPPSLVEVPVFGSPHQRFLDLCLDARGWLWAAADQGLFVRNQTGWHKIDLGMSGAKPDVIAIDHQGTVWASGASQELIRLCLDGYRVIDVKRVGQPPLLSQQIVSLMVDSRGWLWAGHDAGVTTYDGHSWHNYTQDDGLLWNDTDSFALTEDTDGSIWIGTSGGLSHLLTPRDAAATEPSAPVFSNVSYGNAALRNGDSVRWGSSTLEISMALLSFKGTQDAGIRYRLLGSPSADWEESHEMHVHYRRLAPGSYKFEVEEIDSAGHASSPVASFAFTIMPQWWQRASLRAGGVLLIVIAVVIVWRQRIGLLVKQKKNLEEAVKIRTGDLEKEKIELLRTKEQMRHYAEHDDLTGLWNHRIIVDRLRIEIARSQREGLPVSIILVDLDFFKRINDTFGHPAGDQVLKEASATFQRMVRTYDWVGRYGGEEFLLILPGASFTYARQRAEELRVALQTARVQEGQTLIPLTASFGVASGFPSSHEDLIREADTALYQAKNHGRNCVMAVEVDARSSMASVRHVG